MGAPRASTRSKRIAPFEVMDMVAAARRADAAAADGGGEPVLHLEVGQPSARPPRAVTEAARKALEGPLGYTDSLGTGALRSAISELYRQRYGLEVPPERIAVTAGASAGYLLAMLALCDPGDAVAVFEPTYPCYENTAVALGIGVKRIQLDPDTGYVPTPGMLDGAILGGDPLRAVIVASPSNPTGTALDADALAEIHRWCSDNDATLVLDEIYHGTASTTLPTAAAFDDAVVLQSFSKYFCMTGWRLGWLVLPETLVRPVEALQQNLFLAPHSLSQAAALGALAATDELDAHGEDYRRNRDVLVTALRSAGVTEIAPAHGAFYVWADLGRWGDTRELCRVWLEEFGVAATPGTDFDSVRGSSFVRFSVAGSAPEVTEASLRLGRWLSTNGPGAPL